MLRTIRITINPREDLRMTNTRSRDRKKSRQNRAQMFVRISRRQLLISPNRQITRQLLAINPTLLRLWSWILRALFSFQSPLSIKTHLGVHREDTQKIMQACFWLALRARMISIAPRATKTRSAKSHCRKTRKREEGNRPTRAARRKGVRIKINNQVWTFWCQNLLLEKSYWFKNKIN